MKFYSIDRLNSGELGLIVINPDKERAFDELIEEVFTLNPGINNDNLYNLGIECDGGRIFIGGLIKKIYYIFADKDADSLLKMICQVMIKNSM